MDVALEHLANGLGRGAGPAAPDLFDAPQGEERRRRDAPRLARGAIPSRKRQRPQMAEALERHAFHAQEFATPTRHVDLYTAVLASALFESQAFALEIDRINAYSLDFIRACLRDEEARGASFVHGDLQATADFIFCCVRGLMLVHGLKRRVRADADVAGALDVTRRIVASSILRPPPA